MNPWLYFASGTILGICIGLTIATWYCRTHYAVVSDGQHENLPEVSRYDATTSAQVRRGRIKLIYSAPNYTQTI